MPFVCGRYVTYEHLDELHDEARHIEQEESMRAARDEENHDENGDEHGRESA